METVLIAIAAFAAGFIVDRLVFRRGAAPAITSTVESPSRMDGDTEAGSRHPIEPVKVALPEIAAAEPQVAAAPEPEAVQPISEGQAGKPVLHEEKTGGQAGKPVLHGRKPRETTVLVCGIGSNTPDEDVPANVLRCLTDLQRIVAGIIGDEAGSIDRFAGDRVIAVFTAKGRRTDHAGHALEAAQRIASNVVAVSRRLGYDLRIGVGVHSGSLPVGDDGRVDETAIGDAIDVAARLEALASEAKVAVIASEETLARAEESAGGFEAIGEIILPSDDAPHRVFTPRSRDGAVQLDLIDLRAVETAVDHPPVTH